jgi:hypothetical protein
MAPDNSPDAPQTAQTAPPDHPAVDDFGQMQAAFSRGDFREAGRLARQIVARAVARADVSEDVRKRAQFVLHAIRPDPVALGILTACVCLFVGIIWRTFF